MSAPAVSELELEQLALGELPAAEAGRLRRQLEADAALRARLEALERSTAEILLAHPPAVIARAIDDRRRALAAERSLAAGGRRRRLWVLAPALMTTVGLVAVLRPDPATLRPADGGRAGSLDEDRVKGDPTIFVYRRQGDRSEVLTPGAAARAGDVLRLEYAPGGYTHGVIFSVDGAGAVTLHFPPAPSGSTRLDAGRTMLPTAYELDDAPRFERFIFVASNAPIPVAEILARARAAAARGAGGDGSLDLGRGYTQESVALRKVP